MVEWRDHPDMGRVALPNSPLRFHRAGMQPLKFFPDLGEHNVDVFGELLGLEPQAVAALEEQGVC